MVGTLMSSVTDIIDVISYVLIAFVAISLVVSSIMIGVITYISVLERKKEIGILRAIGASKGNISQVFNAETFIIGLTAGLIGIGLTLLILIPGNALIHHLANSQDINAYLPVGGAVILIVLSVLLTLLGGLIPSKKAAPPAMRIVFSEAHLPENDRFELDSAACGRRNSARPFRRQLPLDPIGTAAAGPRR